MILSDAYSGSGTGALYLNLLYGTVNPATVFGMNFKAYHSAPEYDVSSQNQAGNLSWQGPGIYVFLLSDILHHGPEDSIFVIN